MFEFPIHTFSDRLTLLTIAMFAALLLGGPGWLHHYLLLDRPGQWARHLIQRLTRKLNRRHRPASTRRIRGWIFVLFLLVACLLMGSFASRLAISGKWFSLVEIGLIAYLLPLRRPHELTGNIRTAVLSGDLSAAQTEAAPLIQRDDVSRLDIHAISRGTIEYLTREFSTRIIGPGIWYLLLGLPAMLFASALSIVEQQSGGRPVASAPFSGPAMRLHRIMQLIPSRIAGVLLATAAMIAPSCSPTRAWNGMISGSTQPAGGIYGPAYGAVAGALGISLAGPRRWLGQKTDDAWIESGPARISPKTLTGMQYLYLTGCILLILLLLGLHLL